MIYYNKLILNYTTKGRRIMDKVKVWAIVLGAIGTAMVTIATELKK